MEPGSFRDWLTAVPAEIKADSLWKMKAYQLALFAGNIGWRDVSKLTTDRRTRDIADQLYRALSSISANLAQGYSRGTGRDRARFYEDALGSARESRAWYFQARHVLDEKVVNHRLKLLTEIIRLTLAMIPHQRGAIIKEQTAPYFPLRYKPHQAPSSNSRKTSSTLSPMRTSILTFYAVRFTHYGKARRLI